MISSRVGSRVFLAALWLSAAAAVPLAAAPTVTPEESAMARRTLAGDLNREREASHLPPLRPDPALERVAQSRADQIAAGGVADPLVGEVLHERARQFGYDPRFIGEAIIESEGRDPGEVASAWHPGSSLRATALRDDIEDLGIGVGRAGETNIFVFLFALTKGALFSKRTEPLGDREALKREMLVRVNSERAKQGLAPLRLEEHLERAAQRHADDMLARAFYGHETPQGIGPFARALAAGYQPQSVGENVARGQYSVEEVMDGWMKSPPHRQQILDPGLVEVGFGFAHGRNTVGYQVLWVQVFGRPK